MKKEASFSLVIILLILLAFLSLAFCGIIYMDKIIPVKLNIANFDVDESNELCKINSIEKLENNYKIEGNFLKENIKSYELYIGVENKKGETEFYRTQIFPENNTFLSVIRKSCVKDNSKISLLYMCDEQEILIKTNNIIGGKYE